MILVDTSVWVDHLRATNGRLVGLLEAGMVLTHPFVIGELALGNLRQRDIVLDALSDLPQASTATDAEVLLFITHHALFGRGIAARLTAGASLWTRDKRLADAAVQSGLAMALS